MDIKRNKITFTEDELLDFLSVAIENYQGNPAKKPSKLRESMAKGLRFSNYNQLKPLLSPEKKSNTCPECGLDLTKTCSVRQVYYNDNQLEDYALGYYQDNGNFATHGKGECIIENAEETVDVCVQCNHELKEIFAERESLEFIITSENIDNETTYHINGIVVPEASDKYQIIDIDSIRAEFKKSSLKSIETSLEKDAFSAINDEDSPKFLILHKREGRLLSNKLNAATFDRVCLEIINETLGIKSKSQNDSLIITQTPEEAVSDGFIEDYNTNQIALERRKKKYRAKKEVKKT